MTPKKLKKIRQDLLYLRKSPHGIKRAKLETIAKQLGRSRSNIGHEPTYIKTTDPMLRPLTIPGHPGDMKVGTARSIIDQLLSDVDEWEIHLNEENENEA